MIQKEMELGFNLCVASTYVHCSRFQMERMGMSSKGFLDDHKMGEAKLIFKLDYDKIQCALPSPIESSWTPHGVHKSVFFVD